MIRTGSTPIETPGGTFYFGLTSGDRDADGDVDVYAETESGEVTINGVTYNGSVYYTTLSYNRGRYWRTQLCDRWDGKRSKFVPMSDAAQRKLAEWLTPGAESLLADEDRLRQYRIDRAMSNRYYALAEADRHIETANRAAAEARDLGAEVEDVPKFDASK